MWLVAEIERYWRKLLNSVIVCPPGCSGCRATLRHTIVRGSYR